jgi:hypothetical protein
VNRNTFLISYIIIALLAGNLGNPWSATILVMNFAARGIATIASLPVLASLILPFVLSYIAGVRGNKIGRPKLFWLPLSAFALSLLPWAIPLLSRSASSSSHAHEGLVSMYLSILLSVIAVQGPLVLHVICLTLGTQMRIVDSEIPSRR